MLLQVYSLRIHTYTFHGLWKKSQTPCPIILRNTSTQQTVLREHGSKLWHRCITLGSSYRVINNCTCLLAVNAKENGRNLLNVANRSSGSLSKDNNNNIIIIVDKDQLACYDEDLNASMMSLPMELTIKNDNVDCHQHCVTQDDQI